jgi:LPXTG-motif cell wall-anchored protein
MRRIKFTLTAVCASLLLTAAVAPAQGTVADRKTVVTVSAPVSLPGTTLPAGSYVFKIADSPVNRNIVQIFDKDEAKLITTLLAVPAERAQAEGDPLITFKETPSDRPPAVRYWYYAGEKAGNEFVYPKAQAMLIARASGESVSSVDTDATDIESWKKGEVTRVTANAEPQSTASTSSATTASTTSSATTASTTSTATTTAPTAPAPTPQPEPTPTTTAPTTTAPTTTAPTTTAPVTPQPEPTTAPVTPAPATTPTPEPTPTAAPAPVTTAPSISASQPEQPVPTAGRAELPKTGSNLPMVGLVGFLALAGAFAVRVARRSLV